MLPLGAILALQTVASLALQNSAFQDEALCLYVGRQVLDLLRGGPELAEPYGLYFSGSIYAYPLLAAVFDAVGGLEAARLLSLLCLLWVTGAVYLMGRRLYDRDSALLAAAVFAVGGPTLFLGRLATYDGVTLALLALALVLAARADSSRGPLAALGVGAVLATAVAVKYAALLFAPPVLALLVLRTSRGQSWGRGLRRGTLAGLVFLIGLLTLTALDGDVLAGFLYSTGARTAVIPATGLVLAGRAALLGGGLAVLAVLGLAFGKRTDAPVAVLLIAASLLGPVYHLYEGEAVSLHKHVGYGLVFIAPLAGYALARMSGYGPADGIGGRWLAGLALCLALFGVGLRQSQELYREWPNSDGMVHVLRTQVRPTGHFLAEVAEVPAYYLRGVVQPRQWSSLYWFDYTDGAGNRLQGEDAYQAALADGYFDLVVLNYGSQAATSRAIDRDLRDAQRYELIAELPFDTSQGAGNYRVWRKRAG
jgi:hypothetical protein